MKFPQAKTLGRLLVKILFFISALFVLWVTRELYLWYLYFSAFGAWAGYLYIAIALAATLYFLVLPVVSIFLLPAFGEPETSDDPARQKKILKRRAKLLKIPWSQLDGKSIVEMNALLKQELSLRAVEARKLRDRYVLTAAIGTAASQSAVVDLYIVLSCCLKVMFRTLKVYGGRTSLKDTYNLLRDIVISGALGASEFAEIGGNVLAEMGVKSLVKVPGINIVMESAADGLVNAYLVCRVAMITENYCTIAIAGEQKHWMPTLSATAGATRSILSGSYDQIREKLGPAVGKAFSFLLRFGRKEDPEPAI